MGTRAAAYKGCNWGNGELGHWGIGHASWLTVAASCWVHPQIQWHNLANEKYIEANKPNSSRERRCQTNPWWNSKPQCFSKPRKDTENCGIVSTLTGETNQASNVSTPGTNAGLLNLHCAKSSTNPNYVELVKKTDMCRQGGVGQSIQEFKIFKMLDKLVATSSGTDGMPH